MRDADARGRRTGRNGLVAPPDRGTAASEDGATPPTDDLPGSLGVSTYRALFERSPEAHLVQTIGGVILDANAAAAALYGRSREELIGRHFRVTAADADSPDVTEAEQTTRRRGWFRRRGVGLRRDGSAFPQEVVGALLSSPDGDLVLIHARDASGPHALEEAAVELGELARLGEQPHDPATIAQTATRVAVETFGAAGGALVTFEDGRLQWRGVAGEVPARDLLETSVTPTSSGFVRDVLTSGRAARADLRDHSDLSPPAHALLDAGIVGVWAIPVPSGDEHRGFLALLFRDPVPSDAFDAVRLGTIGRIVGTALHNAYLREEMREELDRRVRLQGSAQLADVVVRQAHDPIIVTDAQLVVTRWNDAAERVYGITRAQAMGRHVRRLLDSAGIDGLALPDIAAQVRVRSVWRGRVVQRPRIGGKRGDEVIVDTVVTALRDDHGELTGLVGVDRDVTGSARLEAELASLASLAIETGRARSRNEVADAALAVLSRGTSASAGLIIALDGEERLDVIGRFGVSQAVVDDVAGYGRLGVRLRAALARSDAVVSADLASSPIRDQLVDRLGGDGIGHLLLVGLRVGGELEGLLGLGWPDTPRNPPSNQTVLQAAALVASGIANARLLGWVEQGLEQERRLTTRLETLIDLTRLPVVADDDRALASEILERIVGALGAAAGIVVQIAADDHLHTLAEHALHSGYEALRRARPAHDWSFIRRMEAGSPAFVAPIGPGLVTDVSLSSSTAAGYRAYAAFPIRDDDGGLGGALLTFFEQAPEDLPIDDRTLEAIGRVVVISFANQRLRQTAVASERRYRTLFEESPDALTLQDEQFRLLDANIAAQRMYGLDRDQIVGRDAYDFIVTEQRMTAPIAGRPEVWRAVGRRGDGSTFPQEVVVSRLEVDGEPRELARVRDLTEQEQLQQELVQAQKMEAIGQLVSGVAHELNNPLAAIIAFSQLIRRDPRLPDDLRRDADLLVGEADRTRRIVQNLLDFARQRPPERVASSLRKLVESVLELQAYSLTTGQIEVAVDIAPSIPPIHADRAQMQQVLLNLTQNAVHALRNSGRKPGHLSIVAGVIGSGDDETVRIVVADDGPGVPPEHVDRLFVPFFTTKSPGEGTGLGLPVSFGIVRAHGGQLSFEPGPDGRGARFVITIPVRSGDAAVAVAAASSVTSASASASTSGEAGRSRARPRVLILDDEHAIRTFLAKALRSGGFDADVSEDGPAAIERVGTRPYQVVLCDYRMAGMSGTEVYEALVAIRPDLARRFVIMSGDVLNPDLAAFATEHDIALLAKPFDLDTVQRVVRDVAARDRRSKPRPD